MIATGSCADDPILAKGRDPPGRRLTGLFGGVATCRRIESIAELAVMVEAERVDVALLVNEDRVILRNGDRYDPLRQIRQRLKAKIGRAHV